MRLLKPIFILFLMVGSWFISSAFSQTIPTGIIPFVINNDHIIIQLKIENSQPLNFMFDTGAGGTLITRSMADSLGLKPTLYRKNVGVSGSHKVGVLKGTKVKLGQDDFNITLLSTNTPLEELDDGRLVHGIIGYPILSRYVVEIDYKENQLKLYNRNTFKYEGNGQRLPIEIRLSLPISKASVIMYNGVRFEGNFLMDTGARADVIISSPTVVQYDMSENIGKHYTLRAKIGSSQRKSKIRYGRLKSLSVTNNTFEDIPAVLSSDNTGVLAIPNLNGIIGNRLLKKFKVIFDYQRGLIYLEPYKLLGKDYLINSSGINIYFKAGKPFLKDVIDRSPAAKEIRESFLGVSGKLEIVIMRNRKFKYTEFYLKPLI
jgi:hypothetical protein